MEIKPIQDIYDAKTAVCYGCGRNNDYGLHIQTFWNPETEQGISHFTPRPEHTAFPGYVYGGLLASLIDCHTIGTAIAAYYHDEGREAGTGDEITCVTGNLNVTYLKPTPMDTELTLVAKIKELHERKAIVTCTVYANDEECVKAEVLAVRVKSRWFIEGKPS